MAIADRIRVTITGHLYGQLINTALQYRVDQDGGSDPEVALVGNVDSLYAANVLPLLSQDYAYESTMAQRYNPGPPTAPAVTVAHAGVGGVATISIPPAAAATVTKRTLFAGRAYRGRIFVAGIPPTSTLSGNLTATAITLHTAAWSTLRSITAAGFIFTMILEHRSTNTFSYVTSLAARGPLRVQRRREVGRGK